MFNIPVEHNILLINTKRPVCCLNLLERENTWKVKHVNINKARSIIQEKYFDLICLEIDDNREEIWEFLKEIKNKRLKTKIISIIPNKHSLKEKVLSYGSDDYIYKPFLCEDLILRCKKLTDQIPPKYQKIYQSQFLKYSSKFNVVRYEDTYLPLTPKQIVLIKILLENKYLNKKEIAKYLTTKFEQNYSEEYVSVLIYRTRKKIRMCTGMNLIRNNYGLGYYIL